MRSAFEEPRRERWRSRIHTDVKVDLSQDTSSFLRRVLDVPSSLFKKPSGVVKLRVGGILYGRSLKIVACLKLLGSVLFVEIGRGGNLIFVGHGDAISCSGRDGTTGLQGIEGVDVGGKKEIERG